MGRRMLLCQISHPRSRTQSCLQRMVKANWRWEDAIDLILSLLPRIRSYVGIKLLVSNYGVRSTE